MSVYDINGVELGELYAINGSEINEAYDINSVDVFSGEKPEYGIDNVISYYRTETQAAATEINSLSSDWESFIFSTDVHVSGNAMHSQPIIMYLLANTNINKCFFAGDYVLSDWHEEEYDSYFSTFIENGFSKYIYATIGNHEMMLYGGKTVADLTVIYDDFLASKTGLQGMPNKFYFYFDSLGKKTRYLVLNTADVKQEQLTWLGNSVMLPNSSWNLVVMGHHDIDETNITGQWKSGYSREITERISACNGHVVGYFCGHEHIDQLRYVNNKFYHLISMCDLFTNSNYFNVENFPTRVRNTDSEQAITIVSFNPSTGDVVTRRIGAGDEYTWNYLSEES